MKKYKHIYFDLDRTLWDFETNSKETLRDLLIKFGLEEKIPSLEEFNQSFHIHNERLWSAYRKGGLKKAVLRDTRFILTLADFGIKNNFLAKDFSDGYIKICPTKSALYPFAHEVLKYLKECRYQLYIITNGFKEIQSLKLEYSGLSKYFSRVITSESVGVQKPKARIFEYALNSANARKIESLMIGDDLELDIAGARNFGIDQVYFNPIGNIHNECATWEIKSLLELKDFLK